MRRVPRTGQARSLRKPGGAGVAGGTGSGRRLGSLPMFSLGASTLVLSGLLSRAGSPAGFAASLAGRRCRSSSVLAGSALADSDRAWQPRLGGIHRVGFCLGGFPRSIIFRRGIARSWPLDFWRLFVTGRPRLPCFCLTPDLLSVAACTGGCPSAGMAASGAARDRPYRFASRPGRVPSSCGRLRRHPAGKTPAQVARPTAAGDRAVRADPAFRPAGLGLASFWADPCSGTAGRQPRWITGRTTAPRPCRYRSCSAGAGTPAMTKPDVFFNSPRGLLWQALQVLGEYLRGALAGVEIFAPAPRLL